MDVKAPQSKFEKSTALFDRNHDLVEWDSGFEQEFAVAAPLIRRGASFRDIVRVAYASDTRPTAKRDDEDEERRIEKRLETFGQERAVEYLTDDNHVIAIREYPTPSGGTLRIARNMTAERRGENAIAAARQRIDVTESPLWIRRDANGSMSFSSVTSEAKHLFGVPPEFDCTDFLWLHDRVETTPEEIARNTAIMEASARSMEACSFELRTRGFDGKLRWLCLSLSPVVESDESILWTGVLRNITREKDAEGRAELLQEVVVKSTDAILIVEGTTGRENGTIRYVNPAFERLLCIPRSELIGSPVSMLYLHFFDLGHEERKFMVETLRRGEAGSVEYRIANRNGAIIWVEAQFSNVRQSADGETHAVFMFRDINERRRAQDELVAARDAAEEANRAKSRFLANMSHELRTPLNAIIGFADVMCHEMFGPIGNARYCEYVSSIHGSGQHLLDLINDILDMAKIEAGKLELNITDVDVVETVDECIRTVAERAAEGGVSLNVAMPAEGLVFPADRRAVLQIVLNLLSNAVKFTPAGGRVDVAAQADGGTVRIEVRDTGIGIAPKDLPRLTKPFEQVCDDPMLSKAGTGLGLALVRALVEQHGGRLTIDSPDRNGTIARVEFPRAAAQRTAA